MIVFAAGICVSALEPAYTAAITSPLSGAPGQELTFTVAVTKIVTGTGGLKTAEMTLHFDPSMFSFVSGSAAALKLPTGWSNSTSVADTSAGNITFAAIAGIGASGTSTSSAIMFTFRLKVLSAASGEAKLNFTTLSGTPVTSAFGTVIGTSAGTSFNIVRAQAEIPSKPELVGTADRTVVLMTQRGCEFSYDLKNWQSGATFTGLAQNKTYSFYARTAATANLAASEASEPLTVVLGTGSGGGDSTDDGEDPVLIAKTSNSIAVKVRTNCQYSINNGANWQNIGIFYGLTPNTNYVIYEKNSVTGNIGMLFVKTDAVSVTAPPAPVLSSKTRTSVTLVTTSGCEYSRDKISWQSSGVFSGLSPSTTYTFYARTAASSGAGASDASVGLSVTTEAEVVACVHAHTVESYQAPTCTEPGLRKVTCSECGEVISSAVIAATGHDNEWVTSKEPTCTEPGLREYRCKRCGTVSNSEVIAAKGHTFGAWSVKVAATVDETGLRERTCSVCGEAETEIIPKLPAIETTDGKRGASAGLIALIIVLVVVIIIASVVAILFMLSKNMHKKSKNSGRPTIGGNVQSPPKQRVRGGQTDDQWLGKK